MPKLLVYGNCQANPLASLMGIARPDLEVIRLPAVHTLKPSDEKQVNVAVANADIIVHQPISDRFGSLSTDSLRAEHPTKHWLSFPSIYFGGVFPQMFYIRRPGKPTLHGPLEDYHDRRIVDAFLRGLTVSQAVQEIGRPLGYEADFFAAIDDVREKERAVDVGSLDVIMDLMPAVRPLNTFNHPTADVLWEVAKRCLHALGLPPLEGVQRPKREFLSGLIGAVPAEVLAAAGASWSNPEYIKNGERLEWAQLIGQFFEVYSQEEEFAELYARNVARFGTRSVATGL
ncbi:WcbI family polysaccharide biosynthesis putative acetyltransferase [Brevundimonas sp.]|uniref:WcbI family polysaccharide biosynthesis putative acetyltransferase n=1 Tax=Brevundimonas sp. TaxID=1871086 RepID=UPI0026010C8A|nr:WcbI family polysaccharide biosynthesis putative acetyltransferase [Brevundimonas sp.]